MSDSPAGFDRVAGIYRLLEVAAFGRTLQRARTAHLEALSGCREVLVLGDGDGRCLDAILRIAPEAHILAIDASAAMIARTRRRVIRAGAGHRVTLAQADLRTCTWPEASVDAIVTMFVLDCFTTPDVASIVAALARALRPGGTWLLADFSIPARGWRRWHARAWVGGLYAFFRATTGIDAGALPPSESLIAAQGLQRVSAREFRAGLLRSLRFVRPRPADA